MKSVFHFLIAVILLVTIAPFTAEGSGFMQWSRPQYSAAQTGANTYTSVAGIYSINYVAVTHSPEGQLLTSQPVTDVVDAQTGSRIFSVNQLHFYDTDVVLVPSETPEGYFTCEPLYRHSGEGNLSTQPLWCGILQFSHANASAGAQIILPNGTLVPLLTGDVAGAQLPWKCSKDQPCIVRTQEMRTGQLGGCQRRANSSAAYTGANDLGPLPSSPPRSTHVTVEWAGQLFMMRPLVVAAAATPQLGLSLISTVATPQWSIAPKRIDYLLQYLTIAYPLGPDNKAAPYGPFVKQWAVCALAMLYENGTIVMFDSDRDGPSSGVNASHVAPPVKANTTAAPSVTSGAPQVQSTGLMYFTTSMLPEDHPNCVPYVETVLKLMPCFEDNRTAHAAVYSSTFAVTCVSDGGVGFLFDFVIQAPGQYPAPVSHIGKYEVPSIFNTTDMPPATPVRTEINFVLSQPYATFVGANGHINAHFSPSFAYTVSIAVSRVEHSVFGRSADVEGKTGSPPFVTMTYTSAVSTSENVCPYMTNDLVGVGVVHRYQTEVFGAQLQNVTNSIGWVSTASFPADQQVYISAMTDRRIALADATRRIARWVAADGVAYSVITEDLHLLINGSNGNLIGPQSFYVDDAGTPHGGVKSAPSVRANAYLNASSISPVLAWDVPPPTATGIDRSELSLSSTFVLVTSPPDVNPNPNVPYESQVCTYSLNSHGGITSAQVTLAMNMSFTTNATVVNWVPNTALYVLYSPYTQNFCTNSFYAPKDTEVVIVPAATNLIVIQHDLYNATSTFSRVISVPLRTAIAATTAISYHLEMPLDAANLQVIALNPVGSLMTYICAYDKVVAYHAVVGNETWSLPFSSIPWCQTHQCQCPSRNQLLTITSNRRFLIVNVVSNITDDAFMMGLLVINAVTGGEIYFGTPDYFSAQADQCTQTPPTVPHLGPVTELPTLGGQTIINSLTHRLVWVGAVSMLETRCFVLLRIECWSIEDNCEVTAMPPKPKIASREQYNAMRKAGGGAGGKQAKRSPDEVWQFANGRMGLAGADAVQTVDDEIHYISSATVMYFRGTWAEFDSIIVTQGDAIFFTDTPARDSGSLGASVYCFSASALIAQAVESYTQHVLGALPTFAANNVIDSISINSLWYAVQVTPQRDFSNVTVALNAYQTQGGGSGTLTFYDTSITIAMYNRSDPNVLAKVSSISVFSLPRPGTPKVCVAASNVTCFTATLTLDDKVVSYATADIEHYGTPAVNTIGTMVFTNPGLPCHALIYGILDATIVYKWKGLSWVGMDTGVDMNVDASTCNDAIISDEGLLVMCTEQAQPDRMVGGFQRMYLVEASTGQVLLAYGPTAKSGTTTFSDSGSLLTYVNMFSTAITLELTGSTATEPQIIRNGFCLQDVTASYYIEFSSDNGTIQATKTPFDPSAAVVDLIASATNSPGFPMSAKQFHGFNGLRLGTTFVIDHGLDIILTLWNALPEIIIGEMSFNLLRGPTTFLTHAGFSTMIVASDSCARCSGVTCPTACSVTLDKGDQHMYSMVPGTNNFNVAVKNATSKTFVPTHFGLPIPFSGNASLAVVRLQHDTQSSEQSYQCVDGLLPSPTLTAVPTRYCMAVPELTGRRWTVVEVADDSSFATTTSYSTQWGSDYFTYTQSVYVGTIFQVVNFPTLDNLINNGLAAGSFPNELSNGEVMSAVGTVSVSNVFEYGSLTVYPPSMDDSFVLNGADCKDMDAQIPLCASTYTVFDPSASSDSAVRSVVWNGLPNSNWGNGFVTTGFKVHLSDIMREPIDGPSMQCGGGNATCPAVCQPISNCTSQVISYLNHYLYTYSMLPSGSRAVVPAALKAACGLHPLMQQHLQSVGDGENPEGEAAAVVSEGPIYTAFYCTKGRQVVVTTELNGQEVIIESFSVGSQNTFAGVELTCSDCTFFILYGIISQPIEWIAAGSVKSLAITVLFYFMLDKIRRNHRYQTRQKNRHKYHAKHFEALKMRLREHQMATNVSMTSNDGDGLSPLNSAGRDAAYEAMKRYEFEDQAALHIVRGAHSATPLFAPIADDNDDSKDGSPTTQAPEGTSSEQHAPLNTLAERALLFPGYKRQPVATMTEEERLIELRLLMNEMNRVEYQVTDDAQYEHRRDGNRWWCAKLLPNPITVYSNIVLRLSGIRHPEERRALLARVQDGLSSKDITSRQLIDMLMNITGENASERHIVESFSHFYQWNMCLNRQVVVREFIDESSHFHSPGVIELMEDSLEKTHECLREAYVLFRLAFVDGRTSGKGGGKGRKRAGTRTGDTSAMFTGDVRSSSKATPEVLTNTPPTMTSGSHHPQSTYTSIVSSAPMMMPPSTMGLATTSTRAGKRQSGFVPEDERDARPNSQVALFDNMPSPSTSGLMFNARLVNNNSLATAGSDPSRNMGGPLGSSAAIPYGGGSIRGTPNIGPTRRSNEVGSPPMMSSMVVGTPSLFRPPELRLKQRGESFIRNAKRQYMVESGRAVPPLPYEEEGEDEVIEDVGGPPNNPFVSNGALRGNSQSAAALRAAKAAAAEDYGGCNDVTPNTRSSIARYHPNLQHTDHRRSVGVMPRPSLLGGTAVVDVTGNSSRTVVVPNFSFRGMDGIGQSTSSPGLEARDAKKRDGPQGEGKSSRRNQPDPNASTGVRRVGRYMSLLGGGGSPYSSMTAAPNDLRESPPPAMALAANEVKSCDAFISTTTKAGNNKHLLSPTSSPALRPLRGSSCPEKLSEPLLSSLNMGGPRGDDDEVYSDDEDDDEGDTLRGFVDVDVTKMEGVEWEQYKFTVAAQSLKECVENFVALIPSHPHCFEYAALPSRSIDDKLMPNTLLVIASIVQTIIVLMIYSIDILRRSNSRSEGRLTPFDVYQCTFFMMFNSSGASALLVSVMARADLGALEHTQSIKTKIRDIFTDPYVIFILTLFAFPFATHVLPGMFLYGWIVAPPMAIAVGMEYYLRTKLSKQTKWVIALRFLSRVIILFVVAMTLSISYNYSASYIWSTPEGYFNSGAFRQTSYLQVIADDYWARSITCFYEHITLTISNFMQMGFAQLY